jgi:hypothetical protein
MRTQAPGVRSVAVGFGLAVIRAAVLPRWTAIALMAGVVLVVLSQNLPEGPQLLAAGLRDLGLAAMGAALLRAQQPRPAVPPRVQVTRS